jgi:hypothetical protein
MWCLRDGRMLYLLVICMAKSDQVECELVDVVIRQITYTAWTCLGMSGFFLAFATIAIAQHFHPQPNAESFKDLMSGVATFFSTIPIFLFFNIRLQKSGLVQLKARLARAKQGGDAAEIKKFQDALEDIEGKVTRGEFLKWKII